MIDTPEPLQGSWLLCRVGRFLCGLPLETVVECLRPLPIECLAEAPRAVQGLCVIRGQPVPVVDIGELIGEPSSRPQRMITLHIGPRRVALLADSVIGVRALDPQSVDTLAPLLQEAADECVSAIGALDSELLLILRAARLVPEAWHKSLGATEAKL